MCEIDSVFVSHFHWKEKWSNKAGLQPNDAQELRPKLS